MLTMAKGNTRPPGPLSDNTATWKENNSRYILQPRIFSIKTLAFQLQYLSKGKMSVTKTIQMKC